jgi:hypothetical protein
MKKALIALAIVIALVVLVRFAPALLGIDIHWNGGK